MTEENIIKLFQIFCFMQFPHFSWKLCNIIWNVNHLNEFRSYTFQFSGCINFPVIPFITFCFTFYSELGFSYFLFWVKIIYQNIFDVVRALGKKLWSIYFLVKLFDFYFQMVLEFIDWMFTWPIININWFSIVYTLYICYELLSLVNHVWIRKYTLIILLQTVL